MRRRWLGRPARAIGILAGVQALAVGAYLFVEHRRDAGHSPPFRYERLGRGPQAPEFDLSRPDGSSRPLTEMRGKAVVLHFWATWCEPCREELPGLLDLARALGRDGSLEVVAVTDEDWPAIRSFFGGEVPAGVYRDPGGRLAKLYEVSTLPDTYLLVADGRPSLRFGGARDWRSETAREFLRDEMDGR